MATTELTPRQREIKAELDKGRDPKEIAKKLGITRNAIYQQIRRIREAGGQVKARPGSSRRNGGRQSGRSAPARRPVAPVPNTDGNLMTEMTPLQVIKGRRRDVESEIKVNDRQLTEAKSMLERIEREVKATKAKLSDELSRLTKAETALTGKPQRNGSSGRKRSSSGPARARRARQSSEGTRARAQAAKASGSGSGSGS